MTGPPERQYILRTSEGEQIVAALDALDEWLQLAVGRRESEIWLSPASPAKQLGSLALRVFGLRPRPAVVVQFGGDGALVTFRDRHGGDYRVVNRDFEGQAVRADFRLHDGRRVPHRVDEVLSVAAALDLVRDFFREGDRPWRLSCRPVIS